jgi:hypothetical protein
VAIVFCILESKIQRASAVERRGPSPGESAGRRAKAWAPRAEASNND